MSNRPPSGLRYIAGRGVFVDAGDQLDATANADSAIDMYVQAIYQEWMLAFWMVSWILMLHQISTSWRTWSCPPIVLFVDTHTEVDSTRINDTDNGMMDMRAPVRPRFRRPGGYGKRWLHSMWSNSYKPSLATDDIVFDWTWSRR